MYVTSEQLSKRLSSASSEVSERIPQSQTYLSAQSLLLSAFFTPSHLPSFSLWGAISAAALVEKCTKEGAGLLSWYERTLLLAVIGDLPVQLHRYCLSVSLQRGRAKQLQSYTKIKVGLFCSHLGRSKLSSNTLTYTYLLPSPQQLISQN